MKINYCFHTHTYRCKHAIGTDEEYVLSAIKNGIEFLGFSDHIMLPDVEQNIRGSFSELENYIGSINHLKNKYKDRIKIKLGFEVEYSDRYLSYYKQLLNEKGFDYLIVGQHFDFDNTNTPLYLRDLPDKHLALQKYVQQIKTAIKSGLFLYIAHPDLFVTLYKEFNDECEWAAREICKCAKEHNVPLEINNHALFAWKNCDFLLYPCEDFWKIAGEYENDVVIGYDAHDPKEFSLDISSLINITKKNKCNLKNKLTI